MILEKLIMKKNTDYNKSITIIQQMYNQGYSPEEIAELTGLEITKILKQLNFIWSANIELEVKNNSRLHKPFLIKPLRYLFLCSGVIGLLIIFPLLGVSVDWGAGR